MDTYALKRKNSQPQEPSAGCTFKNPENAEKIPAGKLIDELGLKGYTIGDAMVSQKHANFIINRGNATSNDFLQLVEFIEKKALSLKGIALQPEILMLR
ncbi:MAG: hypothetical protein A2007_05450 [Verrucomicrobia bacterium GWC2_42_7]|nr:MAG: hypothetical protein A2007_05450 [Verrucomicrobia bacterium GWC2_42_7]